MVKILCINLIILSPNPCFRISSSIKPQTPLQAGGGGSENIHLLRQTHKKYLPLSFSAPVARSFETIPVDIGPEKARGIICAPDYFR